MKSPLSHWLGLLLLAGIAWMHYRDVPGKLGETPYLGWLYILLVAGCAAAGAWLLSSAWRAGYGLGLVISLGAIVAYSLTRSTGLPQATGDIGNWAEPSGVISLLLEGAFVVLALVQLRSAQGSAAVHPVTPSTDRQT
ncbi:MULTISPECIES: hypothetical protein [Deinococcus]|uniref:Uncharacterized protein n=1 Tax=Deinococcus rufus TaxID=2136097 RepID=A0ABV7Z7E2_9DEIO|nr:hypothetical protein [Deinococcus sp. AB2017081]WQE97237.1 hypothetical protein U2P90_18445 [Deinococcus sp. AB2017081]